MPSVSQSVRIRRRGRFRLAPASCAAKPQRLQLSLSGWPKRATGSIRTRFNNKGPVETLCEDHGLIQIGAPQGAGAQEVRRTFKRLRRSERVSGSNPCRDGAGNNQIFVARPRICSTCPVVLAPISDRHPSRRDRAECVGRTLATRMTWLSQTQFTLSTVQSLA